MNNVVLIGNIASDIERRDTSSGIARCTFRIAVQRRFANAQGERETDFLPCVAWRQTAEFIDRYFLKGSKIALQGSVQTRSYDAQDGSKRYVTEIIVENAEFAGSKSDSGNAMPNQSSYQQQSAQAPQYEQTRMNTSTGEPVDIDDDELPF